MIFELFMLILFIAMSLNWFRYVLCILYSRRLIKNYKDICILQLADPDISDQKKDLLSTEILSLDRSLDFIKFSFSCSIFSILRDPLMTSKKGGKNK